MSRSTTIAELKEEFENMNRMPMFEVRVNLVGGGCPSYISVTMEIDGDDLIGYHPDLDSKNPDSHKTVVEFDEVFSLDEHLQQMYEQFTETLINGDVFVLLD